MNNNPRDIFEEKTITLKIHPWRVLKYVLLAFVLIGVFFLGRWSVDPPATPSGFSISQWFNFSSGADDEPAEKKAVTVVKAVNSAAPEKTPAESASKVNNTPLSTAPATLPVNNSDDDESSTTEKSVITKYTKVKLELVDVAIDWKETWGKISRISFRISNNEAGIVKVDHLAMVVQGYDDFEKLIPLPNSLKEIDAGKVISSTVPIPSGFSYSETSVGSLANAKITLIALDENKANMASTSKAIDLRGNKTIS